jgi:hypothetical protein
MKKSAIIFLTVISTVALCLALIPSVSSQIENVEVLSYSYYMHPYYNDVLVMVGEVQNTGPNVIDYVVVTGTFYAPDGTVFMQNYVKTLTTQILPQQKSPFYLTFDPSNIVVGTNWTSQDVTNYTITVTTANPTEARQYQDLAITSHSDSTDSYGYYYVSGTVKNTGTQSTNATWVVATFYNSTGGVVSVGYTETILTPTSIPPGGTADFVIYTADYTSAGTIANYSLIIQTKLTASSTPTPSPSTTPSASPTPTAPSSSPTPTPTPTASGNGTAIPDTYVYIAAIVVAIVVVGVVVLALRKRAGKRTAISPEQAE